MIFFCGKNKLLIELSSEVIIGKSKQDESWHTLNLKSLACIERSAELGEVILFQIAGLCK